MADKMDALLTALGQEANEQVDFDGAFAQILAQHQQQEAQAAPQPRRRWRAWRGTLSMAAGMVVVLGTVLIAGQSGLFNAKGAAPEAAAPAEASMYATDAEAEMDVTAEAPAAEIPAAEAPAEAAVSPSVAAIPRDAQPEAETGSSAGGAGQEESAEAAQATSEEAPVAVQVPKTDGVQIQDPDGNQLEAGRKKLSETPAQTALQRLQDAGYPARLVYANKTSVYFLAYSNANRTEHELYRIDIADGANEKLLTNIKSCFVGDGNNFFYVWIR